jgi:glycosidase
MAISQDVEIRIKEHLSFIYKSDLTDEFFCKYVGLINSYDGQPDATSKKWDETDIVLITYGDSIKSASQKPLANLNSFLRNNLSDISCVHILPFFPYSSDDGFSVIDYETVDPALGAWNDIKNINEYFDLQFDLVINHASQNSKWFKNYLDDKSPGIGYFIEADQHSDLSRVVRPRSLPLLTKYETAKGPRWLWTTFSADQLDLNFANPDLLYEMTRILLFYLEMGARIIRLDAIAFLWKQIGTTCLHLPETHEMVKLFRTIFDAIDPHLVLLTETNVPNKENLSYFGDNDEANMVYQFSLPPLLLHALHTGTAEYLTSWAQQLPKLPPENTFFNFTASHDGIGVRPLEGLLQSTEILQLCKNMQSFGGHISRKNNANGTASPYEINISLIDAFKGDEDGPDAWQEQRFMCSQTIMLALRGIPAFYIHSLLATPNYNEGVQRTGQVRSINRRKWDAAELDSFLKTDSIHARIFNELRQRIHIRKKESAFHPDAEQEIIEEQADLFIIRRALLQSEPLYSISNMTKYHVVVDLSDRLNLASRYSNLLTDNTFSISSIHFEPYQTMWLKPAV